MNKLLFYMEKAIIERIAIAFNKSSYKNRLRYGQNWIFSRYGGGGSQEDF
jgi:hypothetical protein